MESTEGIAGVGFQSPVQRLWGAIATLLIVLYTLILGPLSIVMALLARKGWPMDVLGRIWCRWIVKTCGIDIEVRGLEHLDRSRCYVLISNHLSNFDIWCTVAALPVNIRFVAKKELLRIPVFGQALQLSDHIVIDRGRPEEAVAIINRRASGTFGEGFCILFYGEGTRSRDGKVGPFKKGGVVLAIKADLPIVPVAVSGTRKFMPKGAVFVRPGGKVRIVLDRPIETTGIAIEDRDALNERVRAVIVRNYDEDL
jgi:1-acyl-sn-glycerol-3-phosphate acyltransferase